MRLPIWFHIFFILRCEFRLFLLSCVHFQAGANMAQFSQTIQGIDTLFAAAVSEVAQLKGVAPSRLAYSVALLNNAFN